MGDKCVIIVTSCLNMAASFGCCLCHDILPTDHHRRKKLHGSSCENIKKVLVKLSSEDLESYLDTRDPNAFICYKCETELNNVQKLEEKINVLTADIKDKLFKCTKYVH